MKSGNKGGRPTKYKQEYCEEIIEFFSRPISEEFTRKIRTKEGVQEIDVIEATDLPTLASFAVSIGVHRDTLHEWSTKHEEFSDAIKKAKDYQENHLLQNGLANRTNSTLAIFALKDLSGWRNQTDVKLEAEVESNSTVKVESYDLSDRIEQLEKKNDLPESD